MWLDLDPGDMMLSLLQMSLTIFDATVLNVTFNVVRCKSANPKYSFFVFA